MEFPKIRISSVPHWYENSDISRTHSPNPTDITKLQRSTLRCTCNLISVILKSTSAQQWKPRQLSVTEQSTEPSVRGDVTVGQSDKDTSSIHWCTLGECNQISSYVAFCRNEFLVNMWTIPDGSIHLQNFNWLDPSARRDYAWVNLGSNFKSAPNMLSCMSNYSSCRKNYKNI